MSDPAVKEITSIATAGHRLRALREAKGMTRDDVAQAIKYAPRQIDALEADDYSALPAMAVVRGMVRSYAKLLGQEPDALLALVRPIDSVGAPTVTVPSIAVPFPTKTASSSRWVWFVVGALLLGIGAFAVEQFMATRPTGSSTTTSSGGMSIAPLPTTPQTQSVPDTTPSGESTGESGAASGSATAGANPIVAATKRIDMQFTRDSWVEVRGAEGQVLHNRLNPAGSKVTIEDKPPFKLTIGAASGVRLLYDGKPVDLAPNTQVDVARLALE